MRWINNWSWLWDLNPQPPVYKTGALPIELSQLNALSRIGVKPGRPKSQSEFRFLCGEERGAFTVKFKTRLVIIHKAHYHSKIVGRHLKKSAFSLIELMVVVAVIGIITAIALPAYKLFSARARQVEAKTALSGIFITEKAFYDENGSYSACLPAIGYERKGNRAYYAVGFNTFYAGYLGCGPTGSGTCGAYEWTSAGAGVKTCVGGNGGSGWDANANATGTSTLPYLVDGLTIYSGVALPDSDVISTSKFTAYAMGLIGGYINDLPSCAAGTNSWHIDQNRLMLPGCLGAVP
jgi:type IV pilus assembly protein PilA